MTNTIIKDSGQREEYASGARRDNHEGKGRMDLLPAEAILRLTRWYEWGAKKYGDHNWEKGMPIARYLDAALRHAFKYMAGAGDEDHLSAAVWNLLCIMYHEHHQPELQDLPAWKGRKTNWLYHIDYEPDVKKES